MSKYIQKINEYIGKQIKIRRKAMGITQQQLCEYLQVSRPHVVLIEQGKNTTGPHNIWLICNVLSCTPNDLYPPQKAVKIKMVDKTINQTVKVTIQKPILPVRKKKAV